MRMMAVSHEGRSNGRERTIADGASIELQIRSAREHVRASKPAKPATPACFLSMLAPASVDEVDGKGAAAIASNS
jgi:hypothetical protein